MSKLVNQVQLIGRLGADAEMKSTSTGKKIITFRIATNEVYKTSTGDWKEDTQWHQCVLWSEKNTALEKHGKKGNQFIVKGAIYYNEYVDSEGTKRYTTEIRVREVLLLESSKTNQMVKSESF